MRKEVLATGLTFALAGCAGSSITTESLQERMDKAQARLTPVDAGELVYLEDRLNRQGKIEADNSLVLRATMHEDEYVSTLVYDDRRRVQFLMIQVFKGSDVLFLYDGDVTPGDDGLVAPYDGKLDVVKGFEQVDEAQLLSCEDAYGDMVCDEKRHVESIEKHGLAAQALYREAVDSLLTAD